MTHADQEVGSAWIFYMGHLAGLSRLEVSYLPIGEVMDQIACYQIFHGAKEKKRYKGDLFDQMQHLGGGG